MGVTVPREIDPLLQFITTRAPAWAAHRVQIGASPEQIAALDDSLAKARAARLAAAEARALAAAATLEMNDALQKLRDDASSIIRTARTLALNTDDNAVYIAAQIDPPKRRVRAAPPPGQPVLVHADLGPGTGHLHLSWKARNPRGISGVIYRVDRRLVLSDGVTTPRTTLGLSGGRETVFTDTTLPAARPGAPGIVEAQYTITPFRGKQRGPSSAVLSVRFGSPDISAAPSVHPPSPPSPAPTLSPHAPFPPPRARAA